jgi:hypothetical protein
MRTKHRSDHGTRVILLKGTMTGMRQIVRPDTICVPRSGVATFQPHRTLRGQTTSCTDGIRRPSSLSQVRKEVAYRSALCCICKSANSVDVKGIVGYTFIHELIAASQDMDYSL